MTIGPDHRWQKYHATTRNWNVKLQQIHAETEMMFISQSTVIIAIFINVICCVHCV